MKREEIHTNEKFEIIEVPDLKYKAIHEKGSTVIFVRAELPNGKKLDAIDTVINM